MQLEVRDVLTILMIAFGAVATIATMRSESKRQSEQHSELKESTGSRLDQLSRKIDGLSTSISTIMADSREHQVRIGSLEARMARSEHHIDNFGRIFFGKRKASDDYEAS